MGMASISAVRSELAQRIEAIRIGAGARSCNQLASDLQVVRRIAQANGMGPAVSVIHALDSALARGDHGPLIDGWLSILHDAVGCERNDARTGQLFAAACSVRLGA